MNHIMNDFKVIVVNTAIKLQRVSGRFFKKAPLNPQKRIFLSFRSREFGFSKFKRQSK